MRDDEARSLRNDVLWSCGASKSPFQAGVRKMRLVAESTRRSSMEEALAFLQLLRHARLHDEVNREIYQIDACHMNCQRLTA
jgi:hypothetical protein